MNTSNSKQKYDLTTIHSLDNFQSHTVLYEDFSDINYSTSNSLDILKSIKRKFFHNDIHVGTCTSYAKVLYIQIMDKGRVYIGFTTKDDIDNASKDILYNFLKIKYVYPLIHNGNPTLYLKSILKKCRLKKKPKSRHKDINE